MPLKFTHFAKESMRLNNGKNCCLDFVKSKLYLCVFVLGL